jgi:solute carrier family 25 oxoglutarate transporter 11
MTSSSSSRSVNFITAGTGGIMGWCVVHPFNTLSIRMNLASLSNPTNQKPASFVRFVKHTVAKDGISSLYHGISAGIVRQIFYSTSIFGCFELFRDHYAQRFSDGSGQISFFGRVLSGLGSGLVASLVSCPAEVTLVRMSNDITQPSSSRRNYKHVGEAFSRIWKEEGPKAFFRGLGPFANRAVVVGIVQIGCYDQIRHWLRTDVKVENEVYNAFYASMCAGLIYSTLTMPFETAKNRMAFQRVDPITGARPFTSAIQTILQVASKEGLLSLWTGFPPYYLRCGLHTVVMFNSIEWLRRMYSEHVAR